MPHSLPLIGSPVRSNRRRSVSSLNGLSFLLRHLRSRTQTSTHPFTREQCNASWRVPSANKRRAILGTSFLANIVRWIITSAQLSKRHNASDSTYLELLWRYGPFSKFSSVRLSTLKVFCSASIHCEGLLPSTRGVHEILMRSDFCGRF